MSKKKYNEAKSPRGSILESSTLKEGRKRHELFHSHFHSTPPLLSSIKAQDEKQWTYDQASMGSQLNEEFLSVLKLLDMNP